MIQLIMKLSEINIFAELLTTTTNFKNWLYVRIGLRKNTLYKTLSNVKPSLHNVFSYYLRTSLIIMGKKVNINIQFTNISLKICTENVILFMCFVLIINYKLIMFSGLKLKSLCYLPQNVQSSAYDSYTLIARSFC